MHMGAKTIPTVLTVLLLWGGAVSCQSKTEASAEISQSEGVVNADVNVAAFAALIDTAETGLLLDVRTDREFAMGHIRGAAQIDFYRDDFREELAKLDPNVPVYVYCRSGNRSGQAAKMMYTISKEEWVLGHANNRSRNNNRTPTYGKF
jgi:rhodanese-related sulfurtransferase